MLIVQVLRDEPRPPRRLNDRIPRDLETICLKAMAKEPARRYATARDLADDLRRHLKGEPIKARPAGRVGRLWRWCRRNPAVAGLLAALALALMGGLAAVTWKWQEERRARAEADQARQEAEGIVRRLNDANAALEAADLHADAGNWAAAAAELNHAIEVYPDHTRVWSQRGHLYLRLGLWELASQDLTRASALREPVLSRPWYERALLRRYLGDEDGYRKIRAVMLARFGDGGDPDAAIWTARSCVLAPQAGFDADLIARLVEKAPDRRTDDFYVVGCGFHRAGQDELAVGRFRYCLAVRSAWPARALVYPALALAYHRLSKDERDGQAAELARDALRHADQALDAWASALFRSPPGDQPIPWWDWLEFLVWYREAKEQIEGAPPAPDPRLRLTEGRALAALGRADEADAAYAEAQHLGASRGEVQMECFRYFAGRGQWDRADRAFQRAADLNPRSAEPWLERARLCHRLESPDRAAAAYARAGALAEANSPRDLSNADLWQEYARLEVGRDRLAEAADLFGKALALRPLDHRLRRERGRLYAKLGRWDRVAADFTKALEPLGESRGPHDEKSRVASELVGWPEAFARAVALRPDDADLWLARARCFAARSKWDNARADYARAIPSLQPEPNDASWLEYAALLLLMEDAAGYDRLCAAAVARADKEPGLYSRHVLARLCSLGRQTAAEPAQLVRWADPAAKIQTPPPWYLHGLGASYLRAGQPEEAIRWLEASRKKEPDWPGQAMNGIFLALAHQRLGHAAEARHWLEQTDTWLEGARRRLEGGRRDPGASSAPFPEGLYPADWLIVQVLYREAEKQASVMAQGRSR
jgi:tetratricopeptide (TPR) repeat protein